MNIFIFMIFVIFLILIYCIFYIFYTKYSKNYLNLCSFNEIFINNKSFKFTYKQLKHKNIYPQLELVMIYKNNLFCCTKLNQNLNYISTIARLVDFKLSKNKNKYRAKDNKILINELTNMLTESSLKNNHALVFTEYKILYNKLNIKQKENKIFKLLFAEKIILKIIKIKEELDDILKIFIKSKNAKYIKYYKNTTLYYAQILAIFNLNKNKTLIFNQENNIDINYCVKRLYTTLYKYESELNLLINYLLVIFN